MGMVSRLRQYVHAKHDAAKSNRLQEAEAYTAHISSIERRAEMIRRCFLLVLVSLAGTIGSCLLLAASTGKRRRQPPSCSCRSNDPLAGGNLLLHPRSRRGSEFGGEGGLRFAIHGPRVPGLGFEATIRCPRGGGGVPSNTVTTCQGLPGCPRTVLKHDWQVRHRANLHPMGAAVSTRLAPGSRSDPLAPARCDAAPDITTWDRSGPAAPTFAHPADRPYPDRCAD